MRHKDGTWRVLESTATAVKNDKGEIEKLVIVNRDITARKRAEETLSHNAFHDSLTKLPNRALFLDRLEHALLRARRHSDYKFAVLFIDIDEFKVINDSLGLSAGDELLIEIAGRLKGSFRNTDTVARPGTIDESACQSTPESIARLGGDEFTVLLEDVVKPSDAIRVAQRIQERLAIPFDLRKQEIVITASIGAAFSNNSHSGPEDLLRDAELAMYRAKRTGKARCEVFDPTMHASAVRRLQLETDLRRGIERGELVVYYQPIIALQTGKITGFEALSRWQHPDGRIPPVEFIPVANETGLILPINRALLLEACQQLRSWQSQLSCDPPLTMSVNIAPKQFDHPELAKEIGEVLERTGMSPSSVNLEIMESIAMADADRSLRVLWELKALAGC